MPSEFDTSPTRCRVSSPADLIVAVPAMLGFYPTESIVLMFLGGSSGRQIGPIVRYDMIPSSFTEPEVQRVIGSICERAVVVHDDRAIESVVCLFVDPWPSVTHEVVLRALRKEIEQYGMGIHGAYWTPAIGPGQPWRTLAGEPMRGRLPDPSASAVTVAQVWSGRSIYESRDGLVATLAHTPGALADDVARRLDRRPKSPTPESGFARILRALSATESGESVGADTAAAVSRALGHKDVRDAALAFAITDRANAAERLWIQVARLVPEHRRAEPLTLLGHLAYVRGDGATASVAFAAALEADPGHILAGMFDDALQQAVPPETIRTFSDCGFTCAARLGFELRPAG